MTLHRSRSFAFVATIVLVIAACQSAATPAAPTPAPAETSAATPTAAGGAAGASVTIQDFSFQPADVTAKVGEDITWTNKDNVTHTVTLDDNSVDSGNLANGATFIHPFTAAGTFPYHCNIHPSIKGTITVTQ